MELRIPWTVIGFSDPSSHQTYDFAGSSINLTEIFHNETMDLYMEPVMLSAIHPLYQSSAFLSGGQQLLTNISRTLYESPQALNYWWDSWTVGCYCERYKQNAGVLAAYFGTVSRIPLGSNHTWNGTAAQLPTDYQFCECLNTCTQAISQARSMV